MHYLKIFLLISILIFQFLQSNNIGSKEVVEYFSITPISSRQVIEKLKFEEGNLSEEKIRTINWFKRWIDTLSPENLRKFCIVVTGFEYPKTFITVN